MDPIRPTKWRRRDARQRSSVRRVLYWGAITGLGIGLLAQHFVAKSIHEGTEIEILVRLALILPGIIFVAWWLLIPGFSLKNNEPALDISNDVTTRFTQIEKHFDASAIPRTRRHSMPEVDEKTRNMYYRSIHLSDEPASKNRDSFGIKRPVHPPETKHNTGT